MRIMLVHVGKFREEVPFEDHVVVEKQHNISLHDFESAVPGCGQTSKMRRTNVIKPNPVQAVAIPIVKKWGHPSFTRVVSALIDDDELLRKSTLLQKAATCLLQIIRAVLGREHD